MDAKFKERYGEIEQLRASLCSQCRNETDLVMVASLFMFQASLIYERLGGKELVAAQFYGAADRAATEDQQDG